MKNLLMFGLFAALAFSMTSCSSASKEEAAVGAEVVGAMMTSYDPTATSIDSASVHTCTKGGTISVEASLTATSYKVTADYDHCKEYINMEEECGDSTDGTVDGSVDYELSSGSLDEMTIKGDLNIIAGLLDMNCDIDVKLNTNTGEPTADSTICGYTYTELEALSNDSAAMTEMCTLVFGE